MNFINFDQSTLCECYLNRIYSLIPPAKYEIRENAEIYGEILYPSIYKLISYYPLKKDDVFFDLGSGDGKIAAYVFLISKIKAVYGVEIIPALHEKAMAAAKYIKKELPLFYNHGRILNFLLDSFFDCSLSNATILFINSVCFSQSMLIQLGQRINQLSTVHSVFTTRPIPNLTYLQFDQRIRIQCSWDTAFCYVYRSQR